MLEEREDGDEERDGRDFSTECGPSTGPIVTLLHGCHLGLTHTKATLCTSGCTLNLLFAYRYKRH